MIFGAAGQTLSMVLLAVLGAVDTSGAQVVSAVLLFVFNSFFALGWLGMTWLYVSEPFFLLYPLHFLLVLYGTKILNSVNLCCD